MSEIISSGDFVWSSGEAPPRISRKEAMEISQNIMRKAEQERLPEPTDHELNKVLAKWAGVDVINVGMGVWIYYDKADKKRWHPLTDANQMELVKAWLLSQGWGIVQEQDFKKDMEVICGGGVFKTPSGLDYPTVYRGYDPDKKRALALAIWEMEQANHVYS